MMPSEFRFAGGVAGAAPAAGASGVAAAVASASVFGGTIVKITNLLSDVICGALPRGWRRSCPDFRFRTINSPSSANEDTAYANHCPSSDRRDAPIVFQDSYTSYVSGRLAPDCARTTQPDEPITAKAPTTSAAIRMEWRIFMG